MAYTFGAATTNNVLFSVGLTMSADNRQLLLTMWVRPTTLTAGRYLYTAGAANNGALINATTDELTLISNRTTDTQKVTSGVDLAVNEWKFLAFLIANENTGVLDDWRVWAGTPTTPPVEVTITPSVSGSGNISAGSGLTIGNNTGGSVAFQGQIAEVRWANSSATPSAVDHPLQIATSGAITAAETQWIYERFVWPAWEGRSWWPALKSTQAIEYAYWSGLANASAVRYVPTVVGNGTIAPSITGATVAAERCPRTTREHPFLPTPCTRVC